MLSVQAYAQSIERNITNIKVIYIGYSVHSFFSRTPNDIRNFDHYKFKIDIKCTGHIRMAKSILLDNSEKKKSGKRYEDLRLNGDLLIEFYSGDQLADFIFLKSSGNYLIGNSGIEYLPDPNIIEYIKNMFPFYILDPEFR